MIRFALLLWLMALFQAPADTQDTYKSRPRFPEKSEYFAFVDHTLIFTIEVEKPGSILFNFVSMADSDIILTAKNIRITLENRKVPAKLFAIETADPKQPMLLPSLTMHPRSSFGVKLEGNFDEITQMRGATIEAGKEVFRLVPLDSYDFESLVLKVNRINLGSPDFSEDWHVLKMETFGSRSAAGKR